MFSFPLANDLLSYDITKIQLMHKTVLPGAG